MKLAYCHQMVGASLEQKIERKLKNTFTLIIYLFLCLAGFSLAQPLTERYNHLGQMFVPQFSSAPFPHPDRINGHVYDDKTYSAQEHYSDSSVAIFIPKGFKPIEKINFVVYFHGWNNNIDSACAQFNLIEQFCESNRNAISSGLSQLAPTRRGTIS